MLPDLPALTLTDIGYGWSDMRLWIGLASTLLVAIAIAFVPRKKANHE